MYKNFLIVFFFVCSFVRIGIAQDPTSFPYFWEGIWQGDLEIFNTKGVAQTIPMELHILPTDSIHRFTWTLIYGADKEAGKRPYELVIIDADKGWYAIDEKNSIQMESYFIKDKFFSRFQVMNTLLLTMVQKVDDKLIFEITGGAMEAVSVTGDEIVNGDTIPPVQAFPITFLQRATLKRQ